MVSATFFLYPRLHNLVQIAINFVPMGKFNEIIKGNIPTLVDFYATWCGPCQTMSPILEKLKESKGVALRILKIDVDKNPEIASKLGIRGVPTLIYYKNGLQIWRKSGVIPLPELKQLID